MAGNKRTNRKQVSDIVVQDIPEYWFDTAALSTEEQKAVLADEGFVAQKCTGSLKKPVFLFAHTVVKGPWLLPEDGKRLLRELGRSAMMVHWSVESLRDSILKPRLFKHPITKDIYLVTDALHRPPVGGQWSIESVSTSVSQVGPRTLKVVSRTSTGVVRVKDHVDDHPEYLGKHPEVWQHLIHRCLLGCGDSGLHNMLVRPSDGLAVGIDMDENRGQEPVISQASWDELLFKAKPSKALYPVLNQSRLVLKEPLEAIFQRLSTVCNDQTSKKIAEEHRLELRDYEVLRNRLQIVLLS